MWPYIWKLAHKDSKMFFEFLSVELNRIINEYEKMDGIKYIFIWQKSLIFF